MYRWSNFIDRRRPDIFISRPHIICKRLTCSRHARPLINMFPLLHLFHDLIENQRANSVPKHHVNLIGRVDLALLLIVFYYYLLGNTPRITTIFYKNKFIKNKIEILISSTFSPYINGATSCYSFTWLSSLGERFVAKTNKKMIWRACIWSIMWKFCMC